MQKWMIMLLLWPLTTVAGTRDWHGDNAQKIETFLQAFKGKGGVAVFDWDNTVIKNDIGDAVFFWMVGHDLIHQPADWRETSRLLTAKAVDSLNRTCKETKDKRLSTSKNPPCADLLLSIYMDGVLSDKKTPAWRQSYHKDWIEPAYAWVVQLMGGYSPDEMRHLAKRVIHWNLHNPIGHRQKIGSREYAAYLRIYPPIKALIKKLQKNGFDVWVVSASSQYLVETFAKKVGLAADHVIGVRPLLDEAGKITPYFEGCGREPSGNQKMITYRQGKRCWINKVIFQEKNAKAQLTKRSSIVFGAGDSDTDFFFLKDATALRLVINRNKLEVMCHAYNNQDGKWLINPMFIDPKPQKKDGYACREYGIARQRDSVY